MYMQTLSKQYWGTTGLSLLCQCSDTVRVLWFADLLWARPVRLKSGKWCVSVCARYCCTVPQCSEQNRYRYSHAKYDCTYYLRELITKRIKYCVELIFNSSNKVLKIVQALPAFTVYSTNIWWMTLVSRVKFYGSRSIKSDRFEKQTI